MTHPTFEVESGKEAEDEKGDTEGSPRSPTQSKDPTQSQNSFDDSGEFSPGINASRSSKTGFGSFAAAHVELESESSVGRGVIHDFLRRQVNRATTQVISALLILLTVILIALDTDARARGDVPAFWEDIAMFICFLAYFLEFAATVYVEGKDSFYDYWNYIDGIVITTSTFDYIISMISTGDGFGFLKLLRITRLLRLGRLVKKLKLLQYVSWLKEAYILSVMMSSCLRTLLAAFVIVFFVLALWSILAVELLNEVVGKMDWDGCERCPRAFSSVWSANWTFFQTIVAGDSWGLLAIPCIEHAPWSAIIFVGALASIIFGILNLISAVVIDTFAERRQKDIHAMAHEMEFEEIQEKRELQRIFQQIDEDNSGEVSLEELRAGAVKVRDFRNYLRVLDIDDNDLGQLFMMIDGDGSGEVDPEEFIEALYRMKHTDPKTSTRIMKHMVTSMVSRQQELEGRLGYIQQSVLDRLGAVETRLVTDLNGAQGAEEVQQLLHDHASAVDATISQAVERAAAAALGETVESAVSKTSKAIKKLVCTRSTHAARINDHLSRLSRQESGSIAEGSDSNAGDFSRQYSEFDRMTTVDSQAKQAELQNTRLCITSKVGTRGYASTGSMTTRNADDVVELGEGLKGPRGAPSGRPSARRHSEDAKPDAASERLGTASAEPAEAPASGRISGRERSPKGLNSDLEQRASPTSSQKSPRFTLPSFHPDAPQKLESSDPSTPPSPGRRKTSPAVPSSQPAGGSPPLSARLPTRAAFRQSMRSVLNDGGDKKSPKSTSEEQAPETHDPAPAERLGRQQI